MEDKRWAKIYSSAFLPEVEGFKTMLLDNDIPAVVINKKDSSYNTFGEVELYTHDDCVIKALAIIQA